VLRVDIIYSLSWRGCDPREIVLGARKDYENALYLHEVVGSSPNRTALEEYVTLLDR
jgi:hypothetical protein